MGATTLHITLEMLRAGILPRRVPTSKVVKLLSHKKWHRARLYTDDARLILDGKRTGAGRNLDFDMVKVIELKQQLEGNE